MKDKGWQPQQWEILHRLHLAGCPVDTNNLPQPWSPLSVCSADSTLPTHVFPLRTGTAYVLPLKVESFRRITIAQLSLRADWLPPSTGSRIGSCDLDHAKCQRLHECRYGPLDFSKYKGLNLLFNTLPPGCSIIGLFVWISFGVLPENAPAELPSTLCLTDTDGDQHWFGIPIKNVVPSEEALAPLHV